VKRIFLILTALFLMCQVSFGASSCDVVHTDEGPFDVMTYTWTAHTDGTFTAKQSTIAIDGIIVAVVTIPDDTTAPTDNYDIILQNEDGLYLCGETGTVAAPNYDGELANRDSARTEYTKLKPESSEATVHNVGKVTLNILNNSVNSAAGVVKIIYFGSN